MINGLKEPRVSDCVELFVYRVIEGSELAAASGLEPLHRSKKPKNKK
jgi:hypothetical protein